MDKQASNESKGFLTQTARKRFDPYSIKVKRHYPKIILK